MILCETCSSTYEREDLCVFELENSVAFIEAGPRGYTILVDTFPPLGWKPFNAVAGD